MKDFSEKETAVSKQVKSKDKTGIVSGRKVTFSDGTTIKVSKIPGGATVTIKE